MAHASHKRIGATAAGKNTGTGATTEIDIERVPANAVLSNRDKTVSTGPRGQDGKWLQTEQLQDHDANRHED